MSHQTKKYRDLIRVAKLSKTQFQKDLTQIRTDYNRVNNMGLSDQGQLNRLTPLFNQIKELKSKLTVLEKKCENNGLKKELSDLRTLKKDVDATYAQISEDYVELSEDVNEMNKSKREEEREYAFNERYKDKRLDTEINWVLNPFVQIDAFGDDFWAKSKFENHVSPILGKKPLATFQECSVRKLFYNRS